MSLRALAEANGDDTSGIPVTARSQSTTLVFAFDSGYLEPFKTFAFSLLVNNSYIDSPIKIYTSDRHLHESEFLKSCADEIHVLEGEKAEIIEELARDRVKRPERAEWNRGTFLKWSVFEAHETKNIIFLDADMIALRPLEDAFAEHATRPFSCCPQFQSEVRGKDGVKPSSKELFASLAALVEGEFDGGHKSRVNSGVLHLSGEMCSEAFFDEITSYARELPPQINEQSFFSRYFASRQAVLKMMPCTLNFQYAFATSLPVGMQKRIIDTVHVVHFVGMRKPWKLEDFRGANYGELAWHFYDRARRGRFRE